MKLQSIIYALIFFSLCSCQNSSSDAQNGSVNEEVTETDTPIEGVKIGRFVWSKNNLNVSKYRNGEAIRHAKSSEEWKEANKSGEGAWCYYNHDSKNSSFGKLYNYYAVIDARGLAPQGWHVPSYNEWTSLDTALAVIEPGAMPNFHDVGNKLKSTSGWDRNVGTDEVGFSAMPVGYISEDGEFNSMGSSTQWWTTNENGPGWALTILLDSYYLNTINGLRGYGFSVRCVRD